jgi:UDP-glucose 4-epimerase
LNLIRSLDREKIELFVNFGTCEEYGDGKVPFYEDYKEIPVSPYSLSKTLGTYLSSYLAKIENFPIITVRPFLTYGPKQINDQLIPFVIRSLLKKEKINLGKMEQTRDFIHVKDVVSALVKIPFSNIKSGEIINICSGNEIQIKSVVKNICELIGVSFEEHIETTKPYRVGEMMHFYGSNEKAKRLLNWHQEINFDYGLKETIDWYRAYLEENK